MIQRVAPAFAAVAIASLFAGGPSRAGVQGKDTICWLGVGEWQLCMQGAEAYLTERPLPRKRYYARRSFVGWNRDRWTVSAPTIKTDGGKFLSYGLKGREPKVYLTEEKGNHTRWVFEIGERLRPSWKNSDFGYGPAGFTFKAIAAEGDFKGWYLGAEDAPEKGKGKEKEARRKITLVRQEKEAPLFTYAETFYYEGER